MRDWYEAIPCPKRLSGRMALDQRRNVSGSASKSRLSKSWKGCRLRGGGFHISRRLWWASRDLGKPESHPDDELVEALLALTRSDDERVRTGRLRQASGAVTG